MKSFVITVGGRSSPLSLAQIKEVENALQSHHPEIIFEQKVLQTTGDLDQKTSLRGMEKSNFFTKEIDDLLLNQQIRIAIHSAKDLPEPLPEGLTCIALTRGLDPSDALVLKTGYQLETLPVAAKIATSSERREAMVKALRKDLTFIDLRGTIQERLAQLIHEEIYGVVIAEAALIRLKLTHLNRVILPGLTTPYQGRLAILARDDDEEMREIFSCLDASHENHLISRA